MSVGGLDRLIGLTDFLPSDELLGVLQGHAAGRTPLVVLAGMARAVRPEVLVHGQRVVKRGLLVFRTSANEVDAIVHLTD